jgi:hypothetical protein
MQCGGGDRSTASFTMVEGERALFFVVLTQKGTRHFASSSAWGCQSFR